MGGRGAGALLEDPGTTKEQTKVSKETNVQNSLAQDLKKNPSQFGFAGKAEAVVARHSPELANFFVGEMQRKEKGSPKFFEDVAQRANVLIAGLEAERVFGAASLAETPVTAASAHAVCNRTYLGFAGTATENFLRGDNTATADIIKMGELAGNKLRESGAVVPSMQETIVKNISEKEGISESKVYEKYGNQLAKVFEMAGLEFEKPAMKLSPNEAHQALTLSMATLDYLLRLSNGIVTEVKKDLSKKGQTEKAEREAARRANAEERAKEKAKEEKKTAKSESVEDKVIAGNIEKTRSGIGTLMQKNPELEKAYKSPQFTGMFKEELNKGLEDLAMRSGNPALMQEIAKLQKDIEVVNPKGGDGGMKLAAMRPQIQLVVMTAYYTTTSKFVKIERNQIAS